MSPSPTNLGQAVVQGRLSLNVCAHHFIFHGMVWNEITKFRVICFLRNGSERISERFSFRKTDGIPTE